MRPHSTLLAHSLIRVAEDLEGLKVSHDFDGMEEGEERILTLKDSRILENEGEHVPSRCLFSPTDGYMRVTEDELQNVEMAEVEKDKKNQELKIKRRDYTGYDDDEFVEGKEGMKRSLLAKYDDFLEGPKESVRHDTLGYVCPNTHNSLGLPLGQFVYVHEAV